MGESEQVYVLTRDYAREISIRPELIGSSRSSHQANGPGDGWYHFKDRTLKPKRNTLEATFEEKPKIWKSS